MSTDHANLPPVLEHSLCLSTGQRQKEAAKVSEATKKIPHRLHELRPRQPRQPDEVGELPEVLGTTQEHLQSTAETQIGIEMDREQVELLQEPLISEPPTWSEVPTESLNPEEVYEATLSTARFIADADTTIVRSSLVGPMGVPFVDFGDCSNIEVGPEGGSSVVNCAGGSLGYGTSTTVFDPIVRSMPAPSFQVENLQNDVLGQRVPVPDAHIPDPYQDLFTAHRQPATLSTLDDPVLSHIPGPNLIPKISAPQNTTTDTNPSNQQRQLAILTLWHSSSPSQSYPTPAIPSPYLNLLTPYQYVIPLLQPISLSPISDLYSPSL